jgi:hypothetical protein
VSSHSMTVSEAQLAEALVEMEAAMKSI